MRGSDYNPSLNHHRVFWKIWKKSGDITTCLNFISSPHDPLLVALQGQKGLKTWPKMTLKYLFHMLGHNFVKKRERSCHSCVCASMAVETSSLPLMAIHTQLWQLLFHSLLKKLLTQHVVWQFGSCFYFFLWVNEGNYNFWDQEINLKGGRIVLDFLFDYCYCKIVSLGPLKVCIGTKKQKDVIYDGTLSVNEIEV